MVDVIPDLEFPVWGLLPKNETGVTQFLKKYPEYDGRGINVAIFDSGVDPGAPGLQITTTGSCKVIERYDCSGCGDVDTSTIVTPKDGVITGLSGRLLKIPDSWRNPSNNFHLGLKNAFELYPTKLKDRIEAERKEKLWDAPYRMAVAKLNRQMSKYEHLKKKDAGTVPEQELNEKEDLEGRIEFLQNMDKKYNDLGPVYDCVLFHDGDKWMACIDTSENGNLEKGLLLGEYSKTHEYAPLTQSDQLNVSINVHNSGNILEIVGVCSAHGTHVASIAAAYFPDDPQKNGVAPGANIISLTIGDGRLGSMETGTALVRAMIKVMELHKTNPIHVINMSYGEHANWSNAGRIGELMSEVINKYGVVWVASAGNHGPALCTIGTPPDISQNTVIGVGAYVSPDMMYAEYSMRQKLPGMAYTWTSRGPTIDGDLGVSVCAPGGAITSVPAFMLRNTQLLNGTSMSSPHVAGAVGLLISALKDRGIPYSPYNMKRALENGAKYLEDVERFAQGRGLMQVETTFYLLVKHHDCPARDVRFAISWNNYKGIHLRGLPQLLPTECAVSIEPYFLETEDFPLENKIKFNMNLALICKDTYVHYPPFLHIQNLSRTISIKIDLTSLQPGVHYTCINAYDVGNVDKEVVFTIPITIILPILFPEKVPEVVWPASVFRPNTIKRHFILVPEAATWATLKLRSCEINAHGKFLVHCMQIWPRRSCKEHEYQRMIHITSNNDTVLPFSVKGCCILELVVAKYWANLGDNVIDYSLTFNGIKPDIPSITINAVDGLQVVELRTMRCEDIAPVILLKSAVQPLRPVETKLNPLSERDIIPEGRQIYELILTYEFFLQKSSEINPNSPLLSEVLYESEFESQLWMLFDSNKQLLMTGDAYSRKYTAKLEKGDYVVRLHVRHEKRELLDKLTDMPFLISRKLPSPISLDVYATHSHAITQGKKLLGCAVTKGQVTPIYISPILTEKSKISMLPGQYLTGTITYAKDELGKRVDSYAIKYVPYDVPKKSTTKTDKEKCKFEEYEEALRDMKTMYIGKLEVPEQAKLLYEEMKETHPSHFPIYSAMMQSLDPLETKKQLPILSATELGTTNIDTYTTIIDLCDHVLDTIDLDQLLANIAIKNDQRPDAQKIKAAMDKEKTAVIDALSRKGIAHCRILLSRRALHGPEEDKNSETVIKYVWADLLKLIDPMDVKGVPGPAIYFAMWYWTVFQYYGKLLKILTKLLEEKSSKEVEEKLAEVCKLIGWEHCYRFIKDSQLVKYPPGYRPF